MNLSLLLLACLQAPGVKIAPAADGDFARLLATTATYEIRTDAEAGTVREVAVMLEELHKAFVTEFGQADRPAGTALEVSFYASYDSFKRENGMAGMMGMGGYYDPPSKRLHCAMKQPDGSDWKLVLKHEATHQLLHQRLSIGGGRPGEGSSVWFNEGFASYWATARWDGKKALTGAVHPMLFKEYRRLEKEGGLLPLRKLIEAEQNPMTMRTIYTQGWALCHFLRHGKHKEKFGAYLDCERRGEISYEDFLKAFGIAKPELFEKEFRAHMAGLK